MAEEISIKLWYGGTFVSHASRLRYCGGEQKTIRLDIDHVSYFEIVDYVMKTCSYVSKDFIMYYKLPNNGGLKLLTIDADVMDMVEAFRNADEIVNVYVQ